MPDEGCLTKTYQIFCFDSFDHFISYTPVCVQVGKNISSSCYLTFMMRYVLNQTF